jgi:hypothetical protein
MKIRRNRSTEKLEISLRARAIVDIRNYNFFQDFDSLKTLNSLKARKAEIGPFPLSESSSGIEKLTITSIMLTMTIIQSKTLN